MGSEGSNKDLTLMTEFVLSITNEYYHICILIAILAGSLVYFRHHFSKKDPSTKVTMEDLPSKKEQEEKTEQ